MKFSDICETFAFVVFCVFLKLEKWASNSGNLLRSYQLKSLLLSETPYDVQWTVMDITCLHWAFIELEIQI